MLHRIISKLRPNFTTLTHRSVFIWLLLTALFIRFPFFFRDYIDRDESTFILMGQSWVNGYLPYVELWDLKPPLTYLFFAGIIALFGKSFIAIRLIGTLLVASTAFFTYRIGETTTNSKKLSFWAAMGCVALQSMFGSLQGVMSEHISIAFFMPALYFLLKYKQWYWYLGIGLLFGISVMAKLNMAYAILFLGIYILYWHFRKRQFWIGTRNAILYGAGILSIIFLSLAPYYLENKELLWWNSVVLAPLEYSAARRYSFLKMAPICIITIGFLWLSHKKKIVDFSSKNIQLLTITIVGIVFSFVQGGRVNGHYLIQLHPISILFIAIAISSIKFLKRFNYTPYVLFLLFLLPMEAYLEYVAIVKHKIEKHTFFNGEGISVPNYIKENALDTSNILFLEYHIGYWMLDTKPPTKAATHPSNLCRDETFQFYDNPRATSLEELQYIIKELQPKTIVTRKNRAVFDKKEEEENRYMNAVLARYYTPIKTVEKAVIYQRLKGQ